MRQIQNVPYIRRPQVDDLLFECLRSCENCYIQGPLGSGKSQMIAENFSAIQLQENPQAVMIAVCLKKLVASLTSGEKYVKVTKDSWYKELCKAFSSQLEETSLSVVSQTNRKEFETRLRRRERDPNRVDSKFNILVTYFEAVIIATLEVIEPIDIADEKKIKLFVVFENIDALYELERSPYSGEAPHSLVQDFLQGIYQIELNRGKSDEHDYRHYANVSIVLSNSLSLDDVDAASGLNEGMFKAAFREVNLPHFSLAHLREATEKSSFDEEDSSLYEGFSKLDHKKIEGIYALTSGYPVLTIEAVSTVLEPKLESLKDCLVESWKGEIQAIHAWLKAHEDKRLYQLFRKILHKEEPVLYVDKDESHTSLERLGIVREVDNNLIIHNAVFEKIFHAIEKQSVNVLVEDSQIEHPSAVESRRMSDVSVESESLTDDVDKAEENNIGDISSSVESESLAHEANTVTRENSSALDEEQNTNTSFDRNTLSYITALIVLIAIPAAGAAYVVDSFQGKLSNLLFLVIGPQVAAELLRFFRDEEGARRRLLETLKRIPAPAYRKLKRFSAVQKTNGLAMRIRRSWLSFTVWGLIGLLIVFFAWGPFKQTITSIIPRAQNDRINDMASEALKDFKDGREVDGLKQAIEAGNLLRTVDSYRNSAARSPWPIIPGMSYQKLIYPQLVLQYIYANIKQIDIFDVDEPEFIFSQAAVATGESERVAAIAKRKEGTGSQIASDYIVLWSEDSDGRPRQPIKFRVGKKIKDISFDATGQYLLTAGRGGRINLWRWDTLVQSSGERIPDQEIIWGNSTQQVNSARFSPNNLYLAAQTNRDELRIWALDQNNPFDIENVEPIDISPAQALSKDTTQPTRLSISTNCIGSIKPEKSFSDRIQIWSAPEANFADSPAPEAATYISQIDTQPLSNFFNGKKFEIKALVFSPNNQYLAIGGKQENGKGFVAYYKVPADIPNMCVPDSAQLSDPMTIKDDFDDLGSVDAIAIDEAKGDLLVADRSGSFEIVHMEAQSSERVARNLDNEGTASIVLYPAYKSVDNTFLISNKEGDSLNVWSYGGERTRYFLKVYTDLIEDGDAVKSVIVRRKDPTEEKVMAVLTKRGSLFALDNKFGRLDDSTLQKVSTRMSQSGNQTIVDISLDETEKNIVGITNKGEIIIFNWNGTEIDTFRRVPTQSPQFVRFLPQKREARDSNQTEDIIIAVAGSDSIRFYRKDGVLANNITIQGFSLSKFEFSSDGNYMFLQSKPSLSNNSSSIRIYELNNNAEYYPIDSRAYTDFSLYPKPFNGEIVFSTLEHKNSGNQIRFWRINSAFNARLSDNRIVEIASFDSQDFRASGHDKTAKDFLSKLIEPQDVWENIAFYEQDNITYLAIKTQKAALAFDLTDLNWDQSKQKLSKEISRRLAFVFQENWRDVKGFGYDPIHALLGITTSGDGLRGRVVDLDQTLEWGCEWLGRRYHVRYPEEEIDAQLCMK